MWDVYTIGGIELLPDIFNGIAALLGGGLLSSAVKISALVGLIWMVFRVAFGTGWDEGLKWFAVMNVIFQGLLLPTVTVRIVDRLVPSNPGVAVAGVPLGLGVFASMTSQLGDKLTQEFETVFSLPDDMRFQKNGMMFGNGLIAAMRQVQIPSAEFAGNIREFMNQCVFYDIMLGHIPLDEMKRADNLWTFLTSTYPPSPARSFKLSQGGVESIVTCQDGATTLNGMWNGQIDEGITLFGRQIFPGKTDMEARALLLSTLPIAHEYLIGASRTAAQALQQSMMINATNAALEDFVAQSANSAALSAYAAARADAATESAYRTIARQAEQWVPLLRVVLEILFYGIFPLVIVISILPAVGPKVIFNYLMAFMWLQSWPPLYAILHRAMMGHAAGRLTPLGGISDGDPAITMVTQAGIGAVTDDVAVLAGYLTMSVPFIAMAVVRGATAVMGLATSALAVGQRAASQAADEATTGNLSAGNTSFDNHSFNTLQGRRIHSAPSFQTHGLSQSRADGATEAWADSGRYMLNAQMSNFGTDIGLSREISSSMRRAAGESMRVAEQQSVAATQAQAAAVESATGFGLSIAQRAGSGRSLERELGSAEGQALSAGLSKAEELSKQHGISVAEANDIIKRAAGQAQAGISGGFSIGIAKADGGISGIASISNDGTLSHGQRRAMEDAKKFVASEEGRRFVETSQRLAERDNITFADDNAKSLQESYRASLSESQQLAQSAAVSREQARSLEVQAAEAENSSASTRGSYNDAFLDYLRTKYGAEGERIATDMSVAGMARKEEEAREFADQYVRSRMDGHFEPRNVSLSSDTRLRSERGRLEADFDGRGATLRAGAGVAGLAAVGVGTARSMYENQALESRGGDLGVGAHRSNVEQQLQEQRERLDSTRADLERAQSDAQSNHQQNGEHIFDKAGSMLSGAKSMLNRARGEGDDMPTPNVGSATKQK